MSYIVLEDHINFGVLMETLQSIFPYEHPTIPPHPSPGELHVTLFGVMKENGEFILADNELAQAIAASERWHWGLVEYILHAIEQTTGTVTLVPDNPNLPNLTIEAKALRHVSEVPLRHGFFRTNGGTLRALENYNKATIHLHSSAWDFLTKSNSPIKNGRPNHIAKDWYFEQSCVRNGRTLKEIQREMENKFHTSPPSETTIRDWEREYRESSTETP